MINPNLKLISVIKTDVSNKKVEVECTLCGKRSLMWQSHYYRGDTPCDCHHWRKNNPRLYSIYTNMKTRCYNSNSTSYENYGGRGVTVCDEWKTSFIMFKSWAEANGYSDELSLERVNVNGNYEPSNCKWITMEQQARNKTNTIRAYGVCLREWCIENGLNYKLVHQYMTRHPELTVEKVCEYYISKKGVCL